MDDFSFLELLNNAPKWDDHFKTDLTPVLKTEAFLSAVSFLLAELTDTTNFTEFNFADPNDVVKATRQQGRIEGVIQFVERLGDLTRREDG